MSDEKQVVRDYIIKNSENFRIASAIAETIKEIRSEMRQSILLELTSRFHKEFESKGFIVKETLTGKQYSDIRIYKPEWEESTNLNLSFKVSAERGDFTSLIYGIIKKNRNTPFSGNLKDLSRGSESDLEMFFDMKEASGLSQSSLDWVAWQFYDPKYKDLNDDILSESLSEEGFKKTVDALFQPVKHLQESTEKIFEQAIISLQPL